VGGVEGQGLLQAQAVFGYTRLMVAAFGLGAGWAALDRAKLIALINLGLSPFVFWWSRMPEEPLFTTALGILSVSAVLFLSNVNLVLRRLGAMLPDETLRHETRQFTVLNRGLLTLLLLLAGLRLCLAQLANRPSLLSWILIWLDKAGLWLVTLLVLFPLALTMALLWKTKEVILDSVFNRTP
jgi:hypothetical protein